MPEDSLWFRLGRGMHYGTHFLLTGTLRHMTLTDCKKPGKCHLAVCPENREEIQMLMGNSNFCHTPWINRRLPKGVKLSEKALRRDLENV